MAETATVMVTVEEPPAETAILDWSKETVRPDAEGAETEMVPA